MGKFDMINKLGGLNPMMTMLKDLCEELNKINVNLEKQTKILEEIKCHISKD